MVRPFALGLRHIVHASLIQLVVTITPVPFVALQSMEQPGVTSLENDPRKVVTPIDVQKLTEKLQQFNILDKWQHVVHGLKYGFEIGKQGSVEKTFIPPNHKSVEVDPRFVDEYIAGELAAQRYSGPYDPAHLEQLIGPFCTSPLGLVPKQGSSTFRLIQDLSYPRQTATHKSNIGVDPCPRPVNDGIDPDDFPTEWGTFNDCSRLILSLPPGSVAAAFDISGAYRIIPTRPNQQNWLCLSWKEKVFVDHAVCFGLTSSAGLFGAMADVIVDLARKNQLGRFIKWVDDFLGCRLPGETWTEDDFTRLSEDFGVPWKTAKTRKFATVQRYLGFWWDLEGKSVSLPVEKLTAIRNQIQSWLEPQSTFTMKETLQIHGRLIHISCIYPLIRPFIRSLITFAYSFESTRAKLHVPNATNADLSWVIYILDLMPAHMPLSRTEPADFGWWGDASSSFGVAVMMDGKYAVWKWSPHFKVGPHLQYDIKWAEAVAIYVGLIMAVHLQLIPQWHDQGMVTPFLVRSDNESLCKTMARGRSRNREANLVLKEIYQVLASHNTYLKTLHVSSAENISDSLSRGNIDQFLERFPSFQRTHVDLPPTLEDKMIPFYH
jgi:hypothetical protein